MHLRGELSVQNKKHCKALVSELRQQRSAWLKQISCLKQGSSHALHLEYSRICSCVLLHAGNALGLGIVARTLKLLPKMNC